MIVIFTGKTLRGTKISTLTIGKSYNVVDSNGIAYKIRNDKGLLMLYYKEYFKTESTMTNNPTQLPVEVSEEINKQAEDYANKYLNGRVNTYEGSMLLDAYQAGATEYATKLHELQRQNEKLKATAQGWRPLLEEVLRKHESGLLPDRFVYEKIKTFLYGE